MRIWIVSAVLLGLAACTGQSSDPAAQRESIFERFTQHMAGCTARHGYDPEKTDDLGPHQLGSGERDWDQCVYDGVERYLAVNSPLPRAYAALIDMHKTLTDKVEAGEITRQQRRAEVEALFESIRRDEVALHQKEVAKRQADADRDTLRDIERIQRDVDQTRRSLINSM